MEHFIFDFIAEFYFKGIIRSFLILLINRAFITGSNKRALPSVFLGAFFRFTLIVPLSALIHFHDIRLIAEKKRQKENPIWKISHKPEMTQK